MTPLGVSLNDFTYMSNPANAQAVLDQVSSGQMPEPDSNEPPWDHAKVQRTITKTYNHEMQKNPL